MRKILKILLILIAVLLLTFLGWYFLVRDPQVPAGESFRNILPFGSGEGLNLPTTNPSTSLGAGGQFGVSDGRPVQKLFRVTDTPVAGFVILPSSTTTVRYVDRATGHITDADLTTLAKTRITNTTLPKIYEAIFRSNGESVLYRSLRSDDSVENVSLALTPPRAGDPDSLYTPVATILRGEVDEAVAGSGNTLYFVLRDAQAIVSSVFDGTGQRTLFNSPFTSWRLAPAGNSLVVWSKASSDRSGYAYTLNTANGALNKILGPLNGLTLVTNPLGGGLAYSHNEANKTQLFARETLSSIEFEILPATLAEKCTWSTQRGWILYCGVPTSGIGAGEPDNWYKGITRYSDRIWLFDTRVDISEVLAEPKKAYDVDLDIYQPRVSPNEDYLLFIDRNDLSLWALKLE